MDYRNVLTTCPYWGVGCDLYIQALDGEIASPPLSLTLAAGAMVDK